MLDQACPLLLPFLQSIHMLRLLKALERHPSIMAHSLSQVLAQKEKQVLLECLGSLPHMRLPASYAACLRRLGIQPPEAAYLGSADQATAEAQQQALGMTGQGASSYLSAGAGAYVHGRFELDLASEEEAARRREAEQAVSDLGRGAAVRDLLASMPGGDESLSTNPLLAAWRSDVVIDLPDGTQLLAPVTESSGEQISKDGVKDPSSSWLAKVLSNMSASDASMTSSHKAGAARKPLPASRRRRTRKPLQNLMDTTEVCMWSAT
jgi:hypothetical protein